MVVFSHQRFGFDVLHEELSVKQRQADVRNQLGDVLFPFDQVMLYPVENGGENFFFAADVQLRVWY